MNLNVKNVALMALVGAAFVFSANPALASKELARAKNCLACHSVDNQVVGPAYKDVAAKYAGREDAPATLIKKIREGGVGVWGAMPMPPNPQVSDAEAQTLVKWILGFK
jgi:cytochrome c